MPNQSKILPLMSHVTSASHPLFRWSAGATARALVEVGAVGLFAAGVADRLAGDAAPWYLLAAVLLGFAVRAVDLETCALFLPGGAYGAASQAFGRRASVAAASALLVDYLVFGALGASAAGHMLTRSDDLATVVAVCIIGGSWWWLRQGRLLSPSLLGRTSLLAMASLGLTLAVGIVALLFHADVASAILAPFANARPSVAGMLTAFGATLFVIGSPEALFHVSADVAPPRIRRLRDAMWVVNAWSVCVAVIVAFLFGALVPAADRGAWRDAPLAALARFSGLPSPVAFSLAAAAACASALFLASAVHRSAVNAQRLLLRLCEDGVVMRTMRALHPRFGTPARLINLVAVGQLAIVLAAAGQVTWLAKTYGVVIVCGAVLKIASLIRMRERRTEPRAFRVPLNPRIGGREWPLGLAITAVLLGIPTVWLVATADPSAIVALGLLAAGVALLTASEQTAEAAHAEAPDRGLDLVPAPVIGLQPMNVRPGSVLVPLRKPGALAPLAAALQEAGGRDVVAMTVRLTGIDASEERSLASEMTGEERRLLTAAAMLAERQGREIWLLIVPGTNVFDAVAETAARLRSSDVLVGESETLTAHDQARLLGEAWERTSKPEALDVRLHIHHSSGGTAVYQLGAHSPALTNDDLHLIHVIWLDAMKAIGPHVHHRDVVRAALTHMQEQLDQEGPGRDSALDMIRRMAHPADELAAVVHERDFARLRDMVRNRPPSDLAAAFADLSLEDQVVTFRVLPRKLAAETFEYLSRDQQQALVKAMAQEDVAAILNNMAPDDRTTFLEELPAAATQQLLTLLTPEERATAVTLLGYPENSIGRLMTPDYIAVREDWTIQQVLDYVREHGQDSETLNVIYVVDDRGLLIDDIRMREFLLTSPSNRVADLMDRRFVALSASNDQNTAVTIFRREDRLALPVTDSAGVLIGIVTIDDVLDVAEAEATKEMQRVGGSEALDEPYMQIAFPRMIQKRAGWLTALFLGEMLTATAMGAFEREIERAVVLALFVPLIISSGGNSGSQASTLVIRAIALGEVTLRDWWRVARREIGAGLALGSILGLIGFMRITIWSTFSTIYGPHWLLVALTVGLALIGVVLWGTLIGSLLPLLLRRLGFDPATSSAPFVATLVDVTGLVIYFSVGIVVLRGTLL
jgi:magnesium transporter